MAKQFTEPKQEQDEFSQIFSDYRTKLDEITRQMQKNLGFEIPEAVPPAPDPAEIVIEVQSKAELEAGEIFPQVQEEPETREDLNLYPANLETAQVQNEPETREDTNPIPVNLEPVPVKESEEIIREARRKASRIFTEAEKRVKNEAKKKTEVQVNKIITQAQKEAQDIITKARQFVEEQKTEALNTLKQQAQQSIDEIVEKCRQETSEQSGLIIRESRDKAAKMISDILAASKEMSQLMEEAVTSTGQTINDFEARIKAGNEALLQAISQSQNKFLQITMAENEVKAEERKAEQEPQGKRKDAKKNHILAIHLLNNNQNTRDNGLFSGKIEVKSVSTTFDYAYLKNLKKHLLRVPAIKYLQQSASEKAITMLFDITEPIPLLSMLNDIPSIDEVTFETDDNICLTFKNFD